MSSREEECRSHIFTFGFSKKYLVGRERGRIRITLVGNIAEVQKKTNSRE